MAEPRLRTVQKFKPPYPLNKFPAEFAHRLGQELVFLLATRATTDLEGKEWERIFANCIGAIWKPSTIGLDDVVLGQTAWGAKSVKGNPSRDLRVKLISGRNSPVFSLGLTVGRDSNPTELGKGVLEIYNKRVADIKSMYRHVRTVVLIKGKNLSEVAVFELDTSTYDPAKYEWIWNERGNLEGWQKDSNAHKFTWQPHGSQFTIVERVPDDALLLRIKIPERLDQAAVLKQVGFSAEWVTVLKRLEVSG